MKEQHFIKRKEVMLIPEYSGYTYDGVRFMYNRFLKAVGKEVGKRLDLSIEEFAHCSKLPVEYILDKIKTRRNSKTPVKSVS